MVRKINHIGYLRVVLFIIPWLLIVGLFQFIANTLMGIDYDDPNFSKSNEQKVVFEIFTLVGTIIIVWLFSKYFDKVSLKDFGFQVKESKKESFNGFFVGALSIILGFIILLSTGAINIVQINFNLHEIMLLVLIFLCVAISEELFCRGYILRNLMVSFNKYVALILSSIFFAILHLANPNFSTISMISLFLSGLLYGLPLLYNKGLWFPIGCHFSWNLMQSLLGFNVSGHRHYTFLKLENLDSDILTGGNFGFEGSVYTVLVHVLAISFIIFYYEMGNTHLINS